MPLAEVNQVGIQRICNDLPSMASSCSDNVFMIQVVDDVYFSTPNKGGN